MSMLPLNKHEDELLLIMICQLMVNGLLPHPLLAYYATESLS